MLTLKEIEEVRLGRAKVGGYKAEDVDKFIDEVRDSFEKLQNDNAELVSKIKVLAHRVNEYRTQEESVRNALIKAQKIEDDAVKEAKNRAEEILKNANMEADKIISNTKREIVKEKDNLANLKKNVRDFRSNLLAAYKEHLKLINELNAEDRVSEKTLEKMEKAEENKEHQNNDNENLKMKNTEKKVEFNQTNDNVNVNNQNTVNKKFKDLKFGENYDLQTDTNSPVGLFNKN